MVATKPQIQEAQQHQPREMPKVVCLAHHIQITESQRKRRDLESQEKKKTHLTYRGIRIIFTSDFPSEIRQARKKCSKIFKALEKKKKTTNLEFCI